MSSPEGIQPTDTGLPVRDSSLVTPSRRVLFTRVLPAALALVACAPESTGTVAPSPAAQRTDRTEPTFAPRLQVPLGEWKPEFSDSDPTLPKTLADGARITNVTAVIPNAADVEYPGTSRISSGDPAKVVLVEEPNPGDFADIQIDGIATDMLNGRDFWIYGGRVNDHGVTRYAYQNDTAAPCTTVVNAVECPSTYTSKFADVGNEEGERRYFLVSAPSDQRAALSEMSDERAAVEIPDLPPGIVIHDYIELHRKAT